jgi:hypothetical protein
MRYKHMLKAIAMCLITLAYGQTQPPRNPKAPAQKVEKQPPQQVEMQKVQVVKKVNTQIKVEPGILKGQYALYPDNISIRGPLKITVKGHHAVFFDFSNSYVVNDLPPGTYPVVLTGPCYATQRKTVTIHPGETSTLNLHAVYKYKTSCAKYYRYAPPAPGTPP